MLHCNSRCSYKNAAPESERNRCCRCLLDFLLNVVKEIIIKELPQGDPKPIAELLERNNTGVLTFGVEHTVHSGGRNSCTAGKGVDGNASFITQRQNPGGNRFLRIYKTSSFCTIYRWLYSIKSWDISSGIYRNY